MFEKVNPKHPDKIADRIAGAIVDLAYKETKNLRIAVEVLIGQGKCHIFAGTISISPEQAQFLETRKFQINEITRIYRVPPHMVGDLEKSSFSNIEQQSLEFVKYTLDP